ncbi:unnamed protein product, partial [Symbiodinium pilosum]
DLALECQVGLFQLCEKKRQASNFQEVPLECCPELAQRTLAFSFKLLSNPNLLTTPPAMLPEVKVATKPAAAVCVEGVFARTTKMQLARMNIALRGLGRGYVVVAVLSVGSNRMLCPSVKEQLQEAFDDKLGHVICVEDPEKAYFKFKRKFLHAQPNWENRTWWTRNFENLFTGRSDDGVTMTGHYQSWNMKEACLGKIQEMEREGQSFPWVVYLRADLDFLAPHPPLRLMASLGPGRIWIPDVEDWGGLNDRWAVMARDVAPIYLGRVNDLVSGKLLSYLDRDLSADNSSTHSVNAERLLRMVLHYHGIWPKKVHRFLGTAALHCVTGTKPFLCKVRAHGPGTMGWRDESEFSDAYATASRLQRGWSWILSLPRVCQAPCFWSCCTQRAGLGSPDCDNPLWSYSHCCSRNWMLSVVDHSAKRELPDCWNRDAGL